ncbi:MAG: cysteine--tRNA ligase [Calditrichia bacterium]
MSSNSAKMNQNPELARRFPITVYNSIKREKEKFIPLNAPFIGMYVCGPTVYGDPHLGHARKNLAFDVIFRYMTYLGYKVRYVRNITDVGHLEDEVAGSGEDRIAKKARLEQLEPMEVVHHYVRRFHRFYDMLNILRPSIEPTASGHIIEQIELIESILEAGFAYEVNGSVYFDVPKYNASHNYGILSGRNIEDLMSATRDDLAGTSEKHSPQDFALWKKASPEHIMRWPSPWSDGFPGWHLECSVMSTKYLGEEFDIHGGGMDLLFPHHECEIAQNTAGYGKPAVRYWIHNNMLTMNGQKMSKSIGNFITLEQLFNGDHAALEKAYSPMTVRFFTLQSHYRSTVDFSNEALQAAEKGYKRLMNALKVSRTLEYIGKPKIDEDEDKEVQALCDNCFETLSDDFNHARTIATLFDIATRINSYSQGEKKVNTLSEATFARMRKVFADFTVDVLGLEEEAENSSSRLDAAMDVLIGLRQQARADKNFALADQIRNELQSAGIHLKDGRDGTTTYSID